MIKDPKERTEYYKQRNKNIVKFRVSAHEKTILDIAMKDEGWENVSGYIKYKLFGASTDDKIQKIVKGKRMKEISILLFNEMKQLNEQLEFINYRYNKDMEQLFREPGVRPKVWIEATKKSHIEATDMIKGVYKMCELIARTLGIDITPYLLESKKEKDQIDIEAWEKASEKMYEENPVPISRDYAKEFGLG